MTNNFDPSLVTEDWKLQDTLAECSISTKRTLEVFMPHLIYSPWNELQLKILDFLDYCECQKRVITGPRPIKRGVCTES